jgi:hypothetical protein
MEAGTSETPVNFYQTTWRNPEDSHLHTNCCENLKYHLVTSHLQMKYLPKFWLIAPHTNVISGMGTTLKVHKGAE